MLRKRTGQERQRLIQKILAEAGSSDDDSENGPRRGRRGGRRGSRPSTHLNTDQIELDTRTGEGGAP